MEHRWHTIKCSFLDKRHKEFTWKSCLIKVSRWNSLTNPSHTRHTSLWVYHVFTNVGSYKHKIYKVFSPKTDVDFPSLFLKLKELPHKGLSMKFIGQPVSDTRHFSLWVYHVFTNVGTFKVSLQRQTSTSLHTRDRRANCDIPGPCALFRHACAVETRGRFEAEHEK